MGSAMTRIFTTLSALLLLYIGVAPGLYFPQAVVLDETLICLPLKVT